jgi:hypothetical protein
VNEAAPPPAELAVEQALAEKPRRWNRLVAASKPYGDVVDAILKTLVVIGIFFGSYEYFSRQQAARIEKSLAIVDEWSSAGHRDAWGRINDAAFPLYAQSAEAIQAVAGDPAARALLYGNLGDAVTGRDADFSSQTDRDVDQIFYFFERAALCANERICDYGVINTFLGGEVHTFWLYFSRYAERRRELGYPEYGAWTARLADGNIRQALFGLI